MAETDDNVNWLMYQLMSHNSQAVTQNKMTPDCSPTGNLLAEEFCTLHVNNACKLSVFLANQVSGTPQHICKYWKLSLQANYLCPSPGPESSSPRSCHAAGCHYTALQLTHYAA